jgi:hypothetical protein
MVGQLYRIYRIRHVILVLMRNIKQEAKTVRFKQEADYFS